MEKIYAVYILSNKNNTVLYIGVTGNLKKRVWEHKHKIVEGFTERYNVDKLVYYEWSQDIQSALRREKQLKKQTKVGQLLRRRVKVTDFADGGVSISIEQDWDTSSWNDSLIEAGCEALLMVFQDLSEISSEERKERALQMLQKLLSRHKTAEAFLRKNMERSDEHTSELQSPRCKC
jgi:putative endonuclease